MDYQKLVAVYDELEKTSKRLAQTQIIADFLKTIKDDDIPTALLMIEGRVFARWDPREIGVASKLAIKAIGIATGLTQEKIETLLKTTGDLGLVAQVSTSDKTQATLFSESLSVRKVMDNLQKLATLEGPGSTDQKVKAIAELLTSAKPSEAKYIVRTALNDLRIGVGEGTIRDAIVWAYFSKETEANYNKEDHKLEVEDREKYNEYVNYVQSAYDIANEFGPVAVAAKKEGVKGLQAMQMKIGVPLKVMLAIKVKDVADGFERCGKPADFEFKYDGMRMQIHKDKDTVHLFTRRFEDVTTQFPEVVENVKKYVNVDQCVIDAEAVGYDTATKKYLPFQKISQRIKRKYGVEQMAKDLPVEVNCFDLINYKGNSIINEPLKQRKEWLHEIVDQQPQHIICANSLETDDEKKAQAFYDKAVAAGNEGLMVKKLDAPYKPGSRVGYMCKLKSHQDPLDLVIVAAEWGEGKRTSWLSSFTLACIDEDGNFLEIGKVGTGIKEKEEVEGVSFKELTEKLQPLIIEEKGKEVRVKPKIVIEVQYEEIQKSPTYSSGYALRFPRLIQLRDMERGPDDVATLEMIEEYYFQQK